MGMEWGGGDGAFPGDTGNIRTAGEEGLSCEYGQQECNRATSYERSLPPSREMEKMVENGFA